MKKLTFALSLIAATLLTACTGNKKADTNGAGNDSVTAKKDSVPLYVEEEDKTDYSKFAAQPTRIDTTIGDWEIHIREVYDGKSIKSAELTFADYSLKINIYKGGKPVFKNHMIPSKSIAGSDYDKNATISIFDNVFATETAVYLSLTYGAPQSEEYNSYTMVLGANKQVRKFQVTAFAPEGEWDTYIFDIHNFYGMYVNELTQPQPNPASIQKVLNRYCTKGFAQKMQSQTIKNNPLLGSGKFDFQWLRSFVVHSKDAQSNACIVHYQTPDGKKTYKRLQLQKKPKSDDEFVISGVSNATEEDLPQMEGNEDAYAEGNEI